MADPTAPISAWLQALLDQFANTEPRAPFSSIFGDQLSGPNQNKSSYINSRFTPYYNDFLGKLLSDPSLKWTDYLKTKTPGNEFDALTPNQRGERPGLYAPQIQYKSSFGF